MVVARAFGTLMASSLKQNTFLTLEARPGRGRGATDGTGTGGHGGGRDGGTREGARDLFMGGT